MKKVWFIIFAILLIAVSTSEAWDDGWSSGGVETSTECNASKYYKDGTLCQDTDDNKLYLGTGAAILQILSATSIGTIATQNSDNATITGGNVTGLTTLQAANATFTSANITSIKTAVAADNTLSGTPVIITVYDAASNTAYYFKAYPTKP